MSDKNTFYTTPATSYDEEVDVHEIVCMNTMTSGHYIVSPSYMLRAHTIQLPSDDNLHVFFFASILFIFLLPFFW